MKLIKINPTHFILITDDPFTESDWYYDTKQESIRSGSNNHVTGGYKKKIVYSSQPIDGVEYLDISDISDTLNDAKKWRDHDFKQWMIAVDDDESTVEELYKEYLSENKIK